MRKYIILASLFLAGCSHEFRYTRPSAQYNIKNSVIVNKPKDKVWSELIPSLSGTFFVINNIDKDSGLINIDYSGSPEQFVDCGEIYSHIQNLAGERSYSFPASTGYKEYEVWEQTLTPVKRKMELAGKINIVVKEIDSGSTSITVNTKYVLTKTSSLFVVGSYGPYAQTSWQTATESTSFTTNEKGGSFGVGNIECKCNGKLEQLILDLATSGK